MNLSVTNSLPDQISSLRRGAVAQAYGAKAGQATIAPQDASVPVATPTPAKSQPQGTRLVTETRQELAQGGYRRTRVYEQEDGRNFTKVEDSLTDRGARKNVIQQNPSGSIVQYEEVLDRETSGNFRRTQRFQDESGQVSTNITTDYKVLDPFVLSGGGSGASSLSEVPFEPKRGTQLDLTA